MNNTSANNKDLIYYKQWSSETNLCVASANKTPYAASFFRVLLEYSG